MKKKKVALIGSTSFLVSNLAPFLNSEDYTLSFFGRKPNGDFPEAPFHLFNYPETTLDFEPLLQSDIIVFASSLGVQHGQNDPADHVYEVNAFLPSKLLLFLEKNNFKGSIFTFGSYSEIGKNNLEYTSFSEEELINSPYSVANAYAGSKRVLTHFIHNNSFSFSYYHLILPTIYGPGENKNRLIPYIIDSIRSNKEMSLTQGEQIRQYIYIEDLSKLIKEMSKTLPDSGIYNVFAAETLKIKEVIEKIFSHLKGNKNLIRTNTRREDVAMNSLILNSSKLEKIISFKPSVLIEDSIEKYN
jgi:nucleoside-diphosphate-sugar epimerase